MGACGNLKKRSSTVITYYYNLMAQIIPGSATYAATGFKRKFVWELYGRVWSITLSSESTALG